MIIRSRRIVSEDGIADGILEFENGRIIKIESYQENQKVDIDYGKHYIIPGIFDTHNHGTMGYSVMNGNDEKEIKGYLKGLASQGVTNVFPTAGVNTIKTVARLAKEPQDGARILGIHSEGPWLNRVGEKGVKTGWPEVDKEVAHQMIKDGEGLLRLVALAPEIPGIEEIMEIFKQAKVDLAIAHSNCNYEEANKAIDNGIGVATHLANVMTGLHHRDVGVFGACLLRDEVTCELICDGLHVSLAMIEIILKVKDHNKIMMISDCSQMAGAPIGKYKGFFPGNNYIVIDEQGFVLSETGRLCGSSQGIIFGIRNLVNQLGLPIEDVVKMSSLTACKKYGFADEKGSLKEGKYADFVVIDDDMNVLYTYCEGSKIYDYQKDTDIFNSRFLEENRIL